MEPDLLKHTYELVLNLTKQWLSTKIQSANGDYQIAQTFELSEIQWMVQNSIQDDAAELTTASDQKLFRSFHTNPWYVVSVNPWLVEVAVITVLSESQKLYTIKNSKYPKHILSRIADYCSETDNFVERHHDDDNFDQIVKITDSLFDTMMPWLTNAKKNGYTNIDACLKLCKAVKALQTIKGKWVLKFNTTPELEFFANDFENEKAILFAC